MTNRSDSMVPGDEVLDKFGIRPVAPLGGRLNRHWLVSRKDELLVLRLWSETAPVDDIEDEVRLLQSIAALGWPVAAVIEGTIELEGRTWWLFPYLVA
ncbi:phosphotransferase [Paenibacillus sp. GYB003]|uniref:phosphotransferase n=1 Tax=Paenibacillus sp. GYB003 TaxID=2994392 RepID=UPI002F96DC94